MTFFHSIYDHSQFTAVTKISSSGALSQLTYHQMIVFFLFSTYSAFLCVALSFLLQQILLLALQDAVVSDLVKGEDTVCRWGSFFTRSD
jgi:hypothetical protein